MSCTHPFFLKDGSGPHRCRQCGPCKQLRRDQWTARILMELAELASLKKEAPSSMKLSEGFCSSFLTLTYDENHVPRSLEKRALQAFLRRLNRQSIGPIRYFGCGEYGSRYGRPHYHAIVFGLHFRSDSVQKCWNFGRTNVKPVTLGRARYVAKYTLKRKLGPAGSPGRSPEFAIMSKGSSKAPNALGSRYLLRVARSLSFSKLQEVPLCIRMQGKTWPLDYYARNYLSQLLGVPLRQDDVQEPEYIRRMALGAPEAEGRRYASQQKAERAQRRIAANSQF